MISQNHLALALALAALAPGQPLPAPETKNKPPKFSADRAKERGRKNGKRGKRV